MTWAAAHAIAEQAGKISTITFDNGTEFHSYSVLEKVFPVTCYFATPYDSWERGSNENLNGLLRQYLPKGTCMKKLTQKQVMDANPGVNWSKLKINQKIFIPAPQ